MASAVAFSTMKRTSAPTAHESSTEELVDRIVEDTVIDALFAGNALKRRAVLDLVGKSTFLAALSSVFPLAACKSNVKEETEQAARDAGATSQKSPLEKTKLKVGFIPITCATPI